MVACGGGPRRRQSRSSLPNRTSPRQSDRPVCPTPQTPPGIRHSSDYRVINERGFRLGQPGGTPNGKMESGEELSLGPEAGGDPGAAAPTRTSGAPRPPASTDPPPQTRLPGPGRRRDGWLPSAAAASALRADQLALPAFTRSRRSPRSLTSRADVMTPHAARAPPESQAGRAGAAAAAV